MTTKYHRNRTTGGYLMNYRKDSGRLPTFLRKSAFRFKVELMGIEPAIWRVIEVPADYNFWALHVAIQDSMGWLDCHLHHFEIKAKGKMKTVKIGIPDFEGISEEDIYPGWEISIDHYFNDLGVEAEYLYDYGDSWCHRIRLEGYMAREKSASYPRCVEGARACPPEDCGGEQGYERMIEILSKPKHKEHQEMKSWVGEDWRPDRFDKDALKFDDPYKRWRRAFLDRD